MTASSNVLWIMFLQIRTLSTNLQNGGQQLKFGFYFRRKSTPRRSPQLR